MAEVMFVIKSFFAAILLTVVMQIKISNVSMEAHLEHWIATSSVGSYLQEVATGAVKAVSTTSKTVSKFVSEKFGHSSGEPQKASRFNFDFKRSSAKAPSEPASDSSDEE